MAKEIALKRGLKRDFKEPYGIAERWLLERGLGLGEVVS